ncbi:MAG TPA: hypothetical protein VJ778_11610 [Burkholderiales bacterium]|nr:hypothetical protein [Burkholderiales bacterium]
MVDETEAMVWMVGAVLGITLALLARNFWLPGLLIGLFLLVVGLLTELGMMPVIDPHLNVSVENAEALFVLVGTVALFAALAGAYFRWKRKTSKEQESIDVLPPVYREILKHAAEVAGGEDELAQRLDVRSEDVHEWVQGRAIAPAGIYIIALDIHLRSRSADDLPAGKLEGKAGAVEGEISPA